MSKQKIHYLSDLHLECSPMHPLEVCGDILVLAGDIFAGMNFERIAALTRNYRKAKKPIIYVAGNHEFDRREIPALLLKLKTELFNLKITFLHNKSVCINDILFFGATLWTDYLLFGVNNQTKLMNFCESKMPDHGAIYFKKHRKLTAADALRMHEKSRQLLELTLQRNSGRKFVVISHHAPSKQSISPKFTGSILNGAFCSDLSDILKKYSPNLWIHGHVHNSVDYVEHNTRIVCNPRGYSFSNYSENPEFSLSKTILV